jgi:hypothetical protein
VSLIGATIGGTCFTQVLQQQQEGLVRLTEIVMRDLQDTNLMLNSAMGL